jgi:outer membrane protein
MMVVSLPALVLTAVLVPSRVLSLAEAERLAQARHPNLLEARAATEGARARTAGALAPLLPQLTGVAAYQRATSNYATRPGALPSSLAGLASSSSLDTYNHFSAGLTLSQSLWDFGQSYRRYQAARSSAEGYQEGERTARVQALLKVRIAFFQARAQRSLSRVAAETLANQERHLRQIEGFVHVGTRPAVDLAQARTEVANARLQLINAQNNYQTAKAQLNQAMGVVGETGYEVSDDALPPQPGEDSQTGELVAKAIAARPELASLSKQESSQESTLRATRGGYWPSLSFAMSLTESGSELDAMAWNWNATLQLSWQIFQGGQTRAQVREVRASLDGIAAQRSELEQQVRFEVTQALLAVRAAKAAEGASGQAHTAASERLRLAEGRYATGVGTAIELGDAQTKLNDAAAQRIVASYNLASARAQLAAALGR